MMKNTGRRMVCFFFACLLALSLITPDPSIAQRKYRPEMLLPSHYPEVFDGYGRVDRIEGEEIVINDRLFKLSPRFSFATKTSTRAAGELLKVGDTVGFKISADSHVISLWLIEDGSGAR